MDALAKALAEAGLTLESFTWILTALVIPLIVAVFNKYSTPSWAKGLLATILSLVDGIGVAYFTVGVNTTSVIAFFITAVVLSQTFYGQVFKPLGITSFILENIGRKDAPLSGEVDSITVLPLDGE
jgi:glucan phosphoethanolaminetransferase (alkaline phosphatase superfamily)